MRSATSFAFILVMVCLTAAPRPRAQTAVAAGTGQQEIEKLQAELVQAFLNNDTRTLEKYYADDYISIPANGRQLTKAEELENYKSGRVRYKSITVHESTVRMYGDTAIVNVLLAVKVMNNGKEYGHELRNTRVWTRHSGEWQVVAFQATRVGP